METSIVKTKKTFSEKSKKGKVKDPIIKHVLTSCVNRSRAGFFSLTGKVARYP